MYIYLLENSVPYDDIKDEVINEFFTKLENDSEPFLGFDLQSSDTPVEIDANFLLNLDLNIDFKIEEPEKENNNNTMPNNYNYNNNRTAVGDTVHLDHDYQNDPNDPMRNDEYFVAVLLEELQEFCIEVKNRIKSDIFQIFYKYRE